MSVQIKETYSTKKLNQLVKSLGDGASVKVGILGGGNSSRDEGAINNPTLGLIHEFGSEKRGLPPRSFLRMPLEEKARDLYRFARGNSMQRLLKDGNAKQFLRLLGIKAEEAIQMAFESGGYGKWLPIKQATAARKGSTAPLIDTGQLRRSVASEVEGVFK